MDIDWAEWGPPLVALFLGGGVGALMISRLRGGESDPAITAESRRIDLESTRDEVLDQLKQLDFERDKLAPEEYEREREALLARGARALEALDNPESSGPSQPGADAGPARPEPHASPAPSAPAAPAAGASSGGLAPEWKGALYALGAILLVALLWQLLNNMSRNRGEGESITGFDRGAGAAEQNQPPPGQPPPPPNFEEKKAALEAKIAESPDDLDAKNALTNLYLRAAKFREAMTINDEVLKADPTNIDGRVHRAELTLAMSMFDQSLAMIDEVLAEKPDHTQAMILRAAALFSLRRFDDTVAYLEASAAKYPNSPELAMALERAKMAVANGGAPPEPPPGDLIVSGTIGIDPALVANLKGNEVLFVSASNPSKPRPPVAARLVRPPLKFPMPLQLTRDDIQAMPGSGELPPVIDVKVRIDLDGNAMTREPSAPSAMITGVRTGSTGISAKLVIGGAPEAAPQAPGGLVAPLKSGDTGAPTASSAGEVLAAGTATLAPGAAVTGNEVVFVSVKDPAGGPPLAVKRSTAQFPLSFSVTSGDIIQMAGPRNVPAQIDVSIRVDRDGNAMTKEGEPEALIQGVKKGISGLELILK